MSSFVFQLTHWDKSNVHIDFGTKRAQQVAKHGADYWNGLHTSWENQKETQ